jgi:hypothetical protein
MVKICLRYFFAYSQHDDKLVAENIDWQSFCQAENHTTDFAASEKHYKLIKLRLYLAITQCSSQETSFCFINISIAPDLTR